LDRGWFVNLEVYRLPKLVTDIDGVTLDESMRFLAGCQHTPKYRNMVVD
jgi:hypothetical protein